MQRSWERRGKVKRAEAVVKDLSVVVRSLSIARTRCGRDEFYTLRRSYHLTPFHSRGISMAVRGPTSVCVGHEAARDPRDHNETRSTLTENGTELTMSTNLQLSLRQLAPIECRRRPSRSPSGDRSHLSFSTSSRLLFISSRSRAWILSSVETFTPRARDCRK